MSVLREVFDPQFVLRNSVYISLLVGLLCPLVGVFLVLRRLIFMGVALPQVSSAGIAVAFCLPALGFFESGHLGHGHMVGSERALAFAGALGLTLGAILLLALMERRGGGLPEGRVGTAYVIAGAWSILLLAKNPLGERGMLDLLKGEIITVSDTDLLLTLGAFGFVALMLVLFFKEFMLVSYDRDMAITLRKKVWFWDCLLFLCIGLTISMSVLSVGPLVSFGFLLIPPLMARLFARNIVQFLIIACACGAVTALAGFCVAYRLDYPVGPTDVALLGVLYALAYGAHAGGRLVSRKATA